MLTLSEHAAIQNRIKECVFALEDILGRDLALPTVRTDLRGTTAGRAHLNSNEVNVNVVLFRENKEHYVKQTVAHEVAHLIVDQVYGRKVQAHGKEWKETMRLLGLEPDRCHSYDTSNAQVRVKNKFEYSCGCETNLFIGPVRHKKAQRHFRLYQTSGYRCGVCKQSIEYVKPLGQVTNEKANEMMHDNASQKSKKTAGGTKKEQAKNLFKGNPAFSRNAMINLFMNQLDMTKAGASTYYAMCKKEC